MLFAAWNGLGTAFLGLLVLLLAFLMRRAGRRSRRTADRDVPAEVRNEFRAAENSAKRELQKLEVRLYDFSREVDALTQTRIALLQQLITEADRLLQQLQQQLDEAGKNPSSAEPPSDPAQAA